MGRNCFRARAGSWIGYRRHAHVVRYLREVSTLRDWPRATGIDASAPASAPRGADRSLNQI